MSSMFEVPVELGADSYKILVAPGLLDMPGCADVLKRQLSGLPVLLVADSNTERLYGEKVLALIRSCGAASCGLHSFPAGESSKNFAVVEEICRAAFRNRLDRKGVIVALGGGVTGDMAGFAAAIYMRGIRCIQIPTSLLAMIDSSVGGKTAVDLPEGKNLIGAFHQPDLVLMDTALLKTLPDDQIRGGSAELLKHAVLFDPELFELLLEKADIFLKLKDMALITRTIARSCGLKAAVVARDEKEQGDRALLNLGHSFGHALEKLQNFCGFSHGEAVAYGTAVAARLAEFLGFLSPATAERVIDLFRRYGLPVSCNEFTPEAVLDVMQGDKKNIGGRKRLVLPRAIGDCFVYDQADDAVILKAIGACRD